MNFCATCKLFQRSQDKKSVGICHRLPPVPVLYHDADSTLIVWEQPRVSEKDWCGEYQHRPWPTD